MVELIEILDKRKDGDSDEYYFTVEYNGNKYKVMFKDWWFGNRNTGCSCENVWDNEGKKIEIDNEFDNKLNDLFWNSIYGN
tara:strand:- start:1098 stop:1340 length:243 start_codon:yes stop_codon:yes gene_type:complete